MIIKANRGITNYKKLVIAGRYVVRKRIIQEEIRKRKIYYMKRGIS